MHPCFVPCPLQITPPPRRKSLAGEGVSPRLSWSLLPPTAKSPQPALRYVTYRLKNPHFPPQPLPKTPHHLSQHPWVWRWCWPGPLPLKHKVPRVSLIRRVKPPPNMQQQPRSLSCGTTCNKCKCSWRHCSKRRKHLTSRHPVAPTCMHPLLSLPHAIAHPLSPALVTAPRDLSRTPLPVLPRRSPLEDRALVPRFHTGEYNSGHTASLHCLQHIHPLTP